MARNKISRFVAKFAFKIICGLFIAAVVGILIWRMMSSGDPKEIAHLSGNQQISEA